MVQVRDGALDMTRVSPPDVGKRVHYANNAVRVRGGGFGETSVSSFGSR